MTEPLHNSKDLDILASFRALQRAARRAREIGRRNHTPVYVLKRGRIVDLTAEYYAAKRRRT